MNKSKQLEQSINNFKKDLASVHHGDCISDLDRIIAIDAMENQRLREEQEENLIRIINSHTLIQQEDKAIEECSELIKAILKSRYKDGKLEEIVDELADVQIMCEQLMIIYDCQAAVEKRIGYKINRKLERNVMNSDERPDKGNS